MCNFPLDSVRGRLHTRVMLFVKHLALLCAALLTFILLLASAARAAEVSRHDQTASGLQGWLIEDHNIHIELNPLRLDQVRAFYLGRGFSEEMTEQIATACVFQTVIRNISAPDQEVSIDVDLADWRLVEGQVQLPLTGKDEWLRKWAAAGAGRAAQLAFRWATFPARQSFKLTGDYGWGMILFGKPPGEQFDLLIRWRVNDQAAERLVTAMRCPNES